MMGRSGGGNEHQLRKYAPRALFVRLTGRMNVTCCVGGGGVGWRV